MLGILLLTTLIAAAIDARTGRIPNWLTLPSLIFALVWHAVIAGGAIGLMEGLGGALLGGLVPWLMFRSTEGRGIGGGDVKLFAAIGAWAGPMRGIEIELSAFVLLGLFALIRLAFDGVLWKVLTNVAILIVNPLLPKTMRRSIEPASMTTMRMGPAILAATVVVIVRDQWAPDLPWLV